MVKRATIRFKGSELVPSEEDRKIEVGVYDLLLPCRKFDIAYKVAILGKVSQSLEFLLRLVKTIPGIAEEVAATFFGFSQTEIAFVLKEGTDPGFVERRDGRLWLRSAGESLFREGNDEPAIFSVEERRGEMGFDLLALAPQPPRSLDTVEQALPELPIAGPAQAGKVTDTVLEGFGRFFHELAERRDREQTQRRDLYSVDRIVPKNRFQIPVRVRAFARASTPSLPDIDLTSWRAVHEIADRPQIESAAGILIEELKVNANQINSSLAYQVLSELAPEFLKEFITKDGLNVNRYWREAVGRTGEPRADRKTIPVIGPLYSEDNAKRLLNVVEYGLRGDVHPPECFLSIAPQTRFWGATTQQRDMLSYLRRGIAAAAPESSGEIETCCLFFGKAPKFVNKTFDKVHSLDVSEIPAALEIMIIPNIAVAVLVYSPIGASFGYSVPLGLASFDNAVISRTQKFVIERLAIFLRDIKFRDRIFAALQADHCL